MKKIVLGVILASTFAATAHGAERAGPLIRRGGLNGELRTFIASRLNSSGVVLFTAPATGYFVIDQICANATGSNERDINVRVFADSLHVATFSEPQGGAQPKCIQFPSGWVVPRGAEVKCQGGSGHLCWVTGVCTTNCDLP